MPYSQQQSSKKIKPLGNVVITHFKSINVELFQDESQIQIAAIKRE